MYHNMRFGARKRYLHLEVAEQEKPWLAQAARTSSDDRTACAEDNAQPILVAGRTWVWWVGLGSAACRGEECKASIVGVGGRLGSWQRRWMDL